MSKTENREFEAAYAKWLEYETTDFKDGTRFIDFVRVTGDEIDGYGPHWRQADRWQFADHLMRQNHLVIDGWKVLRYSHDDITTKPRRVQQTLQQAFGKWSIANRMNRPALTAAERGVLQWANSLQAVPLTPVHAAEALGLHRKTAAKHLRSLVNKGYLAYGTNGNKRVMRYQTVRMS